MAPQLAAGAVIFCEVLCAISGLLRRMRSERALRLSQPLPSSRVMPVLSGTFAIVALLAVALLMR